MPSDTTGRSWGVVGEPALSCNTQQRAVVSHCHLETWQKLAEHARQLEKYAGANRFRDDSQCVVNSAHELLPMPVDVSLFEWCVFGSKRDRDCSSLLVFCLAFSVQIAIAVVVRDARIQASLPSHVHQFAPTRRASRPAAMSHRYAPQHPRRDPLPAQDHPRPRSD